MWRPETASSHPGSRRRPRARRRAPRRSSPRPCTTPSSPEDTDPPAALPRGRPRLRRRDRSDRRGGRGDRALHCASLVHDDLPCFDDADTRRGKPSVHAHFGAPIAVLAGDALIVLAFETLAREVEAGKLAALIGIVAAAVGAPRGIVSGQAWECEAAVPLVDYHAAKTGALFVGATMAGAASAGVDPEPWRTLGQKIGEAYQVADDLRDVLCTADELGKPIGQDAARVRPNAAAQLGVAGAKARLETLVEAAANAIPACPRRAELCAAIEAQTRALFPAARAGRGLTPRRRCPRAFVPGPRVHRAPEGPARRPHRGSRLPALGDALAPHRLARPAQGPRALRHLRRLRLFADPQRLREA